jgi:hypothetical protein
MGLQEVPNFPLLRETLPYWLGKGISLEWGILQPLQFKV